jgi:nitrite reductase/ring-hydroxylating ferredoxin subunit
VEWIKIFDSKEQAIARMPDRKPQLVIIDALRICFTRLDDSFYAVGDTCSHNGESLSKGNINFMGEVVCPWHGYRFNVQTGRCAENYPDVPIYPVKVDATGLFIGV